MFIKLLRIIDTLHNKTLRNVNFHAGANFIVDTEDSEAHNKVGKTTFLRLIDVAMGAKKKKLIYTDADTNTETTELRKFIENNKVAVELILTDSFNSEQNCTDISLRIDLFPNGHYYINGQQTKQKDYYAELNKFLFANEPNVPTFRELIGSFVRVSVGGDNSAFLKILPYNNNVKYRSVYNFLFKISNPEVDKQINNLQTDLNQSERAEKKYKAVNHVEDVDVQEKILHEYEIEYELIKASLDDMVDANSYKNNRDEITRIRTEYAELTRRIADIDYELMRNESAISSAEKERERTADIELVRNFYNEVHELMPRISVSFEEMVHFNECLCDNRISYFANLRKTLESTRDKLKQRVDTITGKNSNLMALIEQSRLGKYESLQERLTDTAGQIGKRKDIITTLNNFKKHQDNLNKQIENAKRVSAEHTFSYEMTDAFNKYFKQMAYTFTNERPVIVYVEDRSKFPIQIEALQGTSTGSRKALIAAYDFSYQLFAREQHMHVPNFIVHDILENIEGNVLKKIIETSEKIDTQYIVAILKEKLDSSGIDEATQKKLQVLQLSKDDKLFTRNG